MSTRHTKLALLSIHPILRFGLITVFVGLSLFSQTTSHAEAGVGQGCSIFYPCADDLTCHPFVQKCFNSPRLESQPCMLGYECAKGLHCEAGSQVCRRPGEEGETCHLTRPCGSGLTCEAGTHLCRKPSGVDEACHATRPCEDGLTCQPGVHKCFNSPRKISQPCSLGYECADGFYCKAGAHICVPDPVDIQSVKSCEEVRAGDLAVAAKNLDHTMSYGLGGGAAVGVTESIETGTVYGEDGQFGCYMAVCGGVEIDVNISTYMSFGVFNKWDNFAGSSFVISEGASFPVIEGGFATSQVLDVQGGLIGTVNALTFGVGLNPVSVAGLNCCTAVIEGNQSMKELNGYLNSCRTQLETIGKSSSDQPAHDTWKEPTRKTSKDVKGRNVVWVKYDNGKFVQTGERTWAQYSTKGKVRLTFIETKRDKWSVCLQADSRDTQVQIDLHRKQISKGYKGREKTDHYEITLSKRAK